MLAGNRALRVGDEILKCTAGILMRKVGDPRINGVTITGVKISDDLKNGSIYFSLIGSEEDIRRAQAGLDSAKGYIKREIGLCVKLKNVPEIVFKHDSSLETGNRMEKLFQKIKTEESGDDLEQQ